MASLGKYYLQTHVTQFDGSKYAGSNCTPASGANGARAATGGRVMPTGGQIRALIPRNMEADPSKPGWALIDLDRAMVRLSNSTGVHVGFEVETGSGWSAAVSWLEKGHYLAVQGDSDQFSNSTCSGAFNGDHCIGVHPAKMSSSRGRLRWVDDPICRTGRWELETTIYRYASDLNINIRFGVFTTKVPLVAPADVIHGAPPSIGPQPAGAESWVSTQNLARIWRMDSRGIERPIFNEPNGFTFQAWAGPNISEWWAPGPNAPKNPEKAVFRRILGPVHTGLYIRVTDQGSTWDHD